MIHGSNEAQDPAAAAGDQPPYLPPPYLPPPYPHSASLPDVGGTVPGTKTGHFPR
jgi:hypothetical protein